MMRTFIPFNEARKQVLDVAVSMAREVVTLDRCSGRTLAANVVSPSNIPRFDNSAMDGFAVRVQDIQRVGTRLHVIGEIRAGDSLLPNVENGSAVQIMTGAPVPMGADAVVPIEKTKPIDANTVEILVPPKRGDNIRGTGGDIVVGAPVLPKGAVITPPIEGMLANLGLDRVEVSCQPQVAVIATGSELVEPGKNPGPGQIWNSNETGLAAQVLSAGGSIYSRSHVPDESAAIRHAVTEAKDADILLFSGGVSMGKYDLVRTVLEEMGVRWYFWKVKQRPGKPLAFGMLGSSMVFGLPGNPVSSAMCFELHVRPLMARQLGRVRVYRPLLKARLKKKMRKVRGLHYFARGIVDDLPGDGCYLVEETGPQGSHLYSSVVSANCIIHLSEEIENPEAGAEVRIERLEW